MSGFSSKEKHSNNASSASADSVVFDWSAEEGFSAIDDQSGFLRARSDEQWGSTDSENGLDWGKIEIMGGVILIQFVPITGTEHMPCLGRNGASIEEVRQLMSEISENEIRRTIRTILR